jgi:hypothetical protein
VGRAVELHEVASATQSGSEAKCMVHGEPQREIFLQLHSVTANRK